MSAYQTSRELAKRLWSRHPGRLGLVVAIGFLGFDALAVDLGLWQLNLWVRYGGASAVASAGYATAHAWYLDAEERARRAAEAREG